MSQTPFAHLIFALSLPLGALALLGGLFLLLQRRRQTPLRRAAWTPTGLAGAVLWLCGVVITLAGAQHHRAVAGQSALLFGNAFVVFGSLIIFYTVVRSLRTPRL